MKKIALFLALITVPAFANTKFVIDAKASKIEWVGKKVTGQHSGLVDVKSGTVTMKEKEIVAGEFVMDMNSIKDTDITDEGDKKKLVGHLKSDDFFGTDKFAEAKLKVKSAKLISDGKYEVIADLTIKGKTAPITFPAEIKMEKNSLMATGKLMVDRTKYDIKFRSGKFFPDLGDKLINDEFELNFKVSAKK